MRDAQRDANKGRYVLDAVAILDDVLRAWAHQAKRDIVACARCTPGEERENAMTDAILSRQIELRSRPSP